MKYGRVSSHDRINKHYYERKSGRCVFERGRVVKIKQKFLNTARLRVFYFFYFMDTYCFRRCPSRFFFFFAFSARMCHRECNVYINDACIKMVWCNGPGRIRVSLWGVVGPPQ